MPRPQGVRPIAAMDIDDEMMVHCSRRSGRSRLFGGNGGGTCCAFASLSSSCLGAALKARQEEEHHRHREAGAMLLDADYFNDDATHLSKEFRCRFTMNKELFLKIVYERRGVR
ncbi:hypothetical protein QYE76_020553 [Lolium multiflorum]|uniref:Uncharacterized protein n=1 Tax=Lolium multiflorum TaxID=4521 RepID=A0AAD8VRF9_LOLMU|nr:hypothetical protein QYE76_020553 [Lolium multiflorum]